MISNTNILYTPTKRTETVQLRICSNLDNLQTSNLSSFLIINLNLQNYPYTRIRNTLRSRLSA